MTRKKISKWWCSNKSLVYTKACCLHGFLFTIFYFISELPDVAHGDISKPLHAARGTPSSSNRGIDCPSHRRGGDAIQLPGRRGQRSLASNLLLLRIGADVGGPHSDFSSFENRRMTAVRRGGIGQNQRIVVQVQFCRWLVKEIRSVCIDAICGWKELVGSE